MCEIARELERIGREEGIKEGIQTGILAMIRDNLEMGKEKEHILEKLMKNFSITLESATDYYESVVAQ